MALDAFLIFTPVSGDAPRSDATVDLGPSGLKAISPFPDLSTTRRLSAANLFPVLDWSTDVEQTLAIGSQSTGAGAGKIVYNSLKVTRRSDSLSPSLLTQAALGTTFRYVDLLVTKTSGAGVRVGCTAYRFAFCAIATISWTSDSDQPSEDVTLQYGGLGLAFDKQDSSGTSVWGRPLGWNRVKNISWDPLTEF